MRQPFEAMGETPSLTGDAPKASGRHLIKVTKNREREGSKAM